MTDMLAAAARRDGWDGAVRTDDGWRLPLVDATGFRHEFDEDVACGSWEFRLLRPGLSIATVNYTVQQPTPRRHCPGDNLVLSAMLSGTSHMYRDSGFEGELADGYCTLYGVRQDDEFQTFYHPGKPLKWVSVFLERERFFKTTGLDAADLPDDLLRFLAGGEALPPRNIPLSNAALMATTEIFEHSLNGSFAHA